MKRERALQIVLGILGLFFLALIYALYGDLRQANWLQAHNECEPMFLSFYIALGPFLLLAIRRPAMHRSLISFAGWSSLAHASVMTIETVQAWNRGVHRDFTDVVIAAIVGGVLLALLPAKRETAAGVTQEQER